MLTLLRSAAGTWIAKILLGLLIASFAVWGITGASFNFASGSLGSVGSAKISTTDFQREYLLEINRLSRQFGRQITPTQARQFGIDRQVLARMLNQATLDDRVEAFGVGVSDDRIASEILKDPTFLDANGQFDGYRYTQLIAGSGLSEAAFLEEQRKAFQRQQVIDTFASDIVVPKVLKEALSAHANEERTIDYFAVDSRDITPVKAPDDATLEGYFNTNKSRYRAPEYRSLQYIALQTSDFGGADRVSDIEARAYFEQNKERFTVAERRRIRRISFDTEAKARAAEQKLKAGTTFDALLGELGLTSGDVELGLLEKAAILDRKLADAAFNLPVKTASGVIDGDFGKMIAYVDDVQGGTTQTFEQLAPTIKGELASDQNNRELLEKLDQVEDALGAGNTFSEIATKFSLKLVKVKDVAQNGTLRAGGDISPATPALNPLLDEAFETDIGIENDVIEIGRDGFLWFEVTHIKAARDQTFQEVKQLVSADWMTSETEKALAAKADEITASLNAGKTMAFVAEENGQEVTRIGSVKRNQPVDGLSGAAVTIAFQGAKGFASSAPGDQSNQFFVLQIADISKGNSAANEQADEELSVALQNDVLETYILRIRQREGASINPDAVEFATDLDGQRGYGHQGGNYN